MRTGNERVLRARFNDAQFFWNVDLRRKLQDRLEDLKNVTFQAKLGSYYEKTMRMVQLATQIGELSGRIVRCAPEPRHSRSVTSPTEMVKELTELQGIVGGLYAREQGEPLEIWRAVYEHYKPVSMEDSIPSTIIGQCVALADKADTLRGCFAIGLVPTGSKDPFALRRAAQGIVKIVVEGRLRIKLRDLIGDNPQLREFLIDRVKYYFRDVRGFQYDEVNAVLAPDVDDLVDVGSSAARRSGTSVRHRKFRASGRELQTNCEHSASGAVHRIRSDRRGPAGAWTRARFVQRLSADTRRCFTHRKSRNYQAALEAIASLRAEVDTFFDKVLVNAPEERVRQNRLLLLSSLLTEFSAIADFSEIVNALSLRPLLPTERKKENRSDGKKYVYSFGGGTAEGNKDMKDTLGGKGASLAEMCNAGVPVPPGFTISTEVCNIYFNNNRQVPTEVDDQIRKALAKVEKASARSWAMPTNPLLISVAPARSSPCRA